MIRSLSMCLVLALVSCGPKKDGGAAPPNDPYAKPAAEPETTPSSDPTGAECTARCLESDRYKDQELDLREKSCQAECPAEPGTAVDAEAANAEGVAGSPAEGG
jgi:hypothetical protein